MGDKPLRDDLEGMSWAAATIAWAYYCSLRERGEDHGRAILMMACGVFGAAKWAEQKSDHVRAMRTAYVAFCEKYNEVMDNYSKEEEARRRGGPSTAAKAAVVDLLKSMGFGA